MPVQTSKFATTIKGFDENFYLYRLSLANVERKS
jgi:hypothetical protein